MPSLNGLRAFATVAETGSFSSAGTALNVSHAAVSQQVRALEERLGVTLVTRQGRGVALTAEGVALARDLSAGFATIRRGVETLTGADAWRPVQVTMSPAFAVKWLMPRITDFQQRNPDVTLMLNPTGQVVELAPGGVDVAIRFGRGEWPGLEVTPLILPALVVLGAPDLIGSRDPADPSTFTDLPWLQELGTNEVGDWMARRGIDPVEPPKIVHMPGNLIMDALLRGDGLTYTPRVFHEADIAAGRLVELASETDVGGFYIVTRPGVKRPAVKIFLSWLKAHAAGVRPMRPMRCPT